MDNLMEKLEFAKKQEEIAKSERQKVEMELMAKMFFEEGWKERGIYEDQKKASEAARVLSNHKKKYHNIYSDLNN